MNTKIMAAMMVLLAIGVGMVTVVRGGQKIRVGQAVVAANQVSMDEIKHSTWDQLLQKHVNERGQVNYKDWKSSANDVASLDNYLKTLSTASRTKPATTGSQLAFWINAYNAVTVKGILREYPTTSIRNHTAKLIGYNIWEDLLLAVGDSEISLNEMEHEVLRKMGEPRIHFAIVCASHSCPRLLNRAYTAEKIELQLSENTTEFFANPENFQHDVQRKQFRVSSILDWFKDDFGKDKSAQLKTIAPYLPSDEAKQAAADNAIGISYLSYDWRLNEQR